MLMLDYILPKTTLTDPALRGSARLLWQTLGEILDVQIKAPKCLHIGEYIVMTWRTSRLVVDVYVANDGTMSWSMCCVPIDAEAEVERPPYRLVQILQRSFTYSPNRSVIRDLQIGLLMEAGLTCGEVVNSLPCQLKTVLNAFSLWATIKSYVTKGIALADGLPPDVMGAYLRELADCGAVRSGR